MNFYNEETQLTQPVGNNAIHYAERMALGSQGKLYIPRLVTGTLDDLTLSDNIVFEEIENDSLISCTGLTSLLKISHNNKTIYNTDNHNHALYFRYEALHNGLISPGATLLHVDQHADMNMPDELIDVTHAHNLSYIAEYVNTKTQIASFIEPALHSGLLKESIQIRSEAKLQEIADNPPVGNVILDIDIDFFAHETDISSKIDLLRTLISSVSVITIATSPYFIDQQKALNIINRLLQ